MALLRDETELMCNFDEVIAFKLLSELYVTVDNKPLDQSEFTLDGKYIDYNGDLYLSPSIVNKITSLEIPGFVLREVQGSFNCRLATNLKSLKGAPEKVLLAFDCTLCGSLETLEGAPRYIGDSFCCGGCRNLVSLKGAPKRVRESFNCCYCPNLETLEGAPEEVGGWFFCGGCKKINQEEQSKLNYDIKWHY